MAWTDFENQVVRVRRVKISTLDDQGLPISDKFAIMAECSGHVSFSSMYDTLPDLAAVLRQHSGLVEFLYRTACGYLDEDELRDLHLQLRANPQLQHRFHLVPIFSKIDEEKADYYEMGQCPVGMDEVPPRLHEGCEEPSYRKGG